MLEEYLKWFTKTPKYTAWEFFVLSP
jgi:hypothetical protein